MAEKDYRTMFIRDIEAELAPRFSPEQTETVSAVLLKVLANYEITERCTELTVLDGRNERTVRRYGACLSVDGKSEKTIKQYLRSCRKLNNVMGKPFAEMNAYDVRFYLALEKDRGLSNRSLETERANLSAFFQWMTNEEIIPKNPMAVIKPIKYPDEIRKPFSGVEIDALRGACKRAKERALIEFLLSTGVRVSELTSMMVEDIDFKDLSVHVIHGKGSKERVTYMSPVSAKHLETYLVERNDSGSHLFYNKNHKPLATEGVRFILNTIGSRAEVEDVHPHRFRRTFATSLAKRGMEIQEIQRLLGHSDLNTTMVYVHVDDASVQSSYRKYTV